MGWCPAAFGFRVNHFTVNVNALTTFPDLPALNAFLFDHGFTLNEAGGAIKGTPAQLLEQSSTRADSIDVQFADETLRIPSCYYEFARRYPRPDGTLFHGFVPASADKISSRPTSSLNGKRREVVVQLEQDVDVDADELNAHPRGIRGARPAHDRRQDEYAVRGWQRQLDGQGRPDLLDLRRRDVGAADTDVAGFRGDPRRMKRRLVADRQDTSGACFAPEKCLRSYRSRSIPPGMIRDSSDGKGLYPGPLTTVGSRRQ